MHAQLFQLSVTEGNICQFLLSKGWRPSTPRWRPSAPSERLTPFYYSRWPSHQTLIRPYLLRESSETPHQTNTSSCIGVLRESWEWSPRGVAQRHAQASHYLPDEGPQTLHVSRDPTDSGRPRGLPEGIKCYSLSVLKYEQYTKTPDYSLYIFSGELRLTKASEPPRPAPNRCPLRSLSCLLQIFRSSARLMVVNWFSSNFSSWLAVQLLIWRCKLRSFPWRCRFQTSTVGTVCGKKMSPLTNCTAAKLIS